MSTIVPNFFNTSEKPPLLSEPKKDCCYRCRIWKLDRKTQKKIVIGSVIMIGGMLSFLTYDSINTLMHEPITSKRSIISIGVLGIEGTLGVVASCCASIYGCIVHQHKKALSQFPHQQYYQGSALIDSEYGIQQKNNCCSREICIPLLECYFKDLDARKLLEPWMKFKKFSSREAFLEFMYTEMRGGLCSGYSLALLSLMKDHANASSLDLLDRISFQQIYYFQFISEFINECFKNRDLMSIMLHYLFIFKNRPLNGYGIDIAKMIDSPFILHLIFLNYDFINSIVKEKKLKDIHCVDSNNLKECFTKIFKEMEEAHKIKFTPDQDFGSTTKAGFIALNESQENRKKEGKHPGHALFFQYSNNHFRFHDSGSTVSGFFEFPSEDLFFDGLLKHVQQWQNYKDGELEFTILSIPQSKSDDIKIDVI